MFSKILHMINLTKIIAITFLYQRSSSYPAAGSHFCSHTDPPVVFSSPRKTLKAFPGSKLAFVIDPYSISNLLAILPTLGNSIKQID